MDIDKLREIESYKYRCSNCGGVSSKRKPGSPELIYGVCEECGKRNNLRMVDDAT